MSNYTKSTNFATKDNLTPGDPLKVVRGTEIDTEYNNIATAVATKTDNASAAITGGTIDGATVGATTPATGAFTTLAASGTTTLAGALVGAVTQAAFNTVSTTLNLGGAATAVNLGAATGTATVNNTTLAAKAITASTTLAVTGTSTLTGAVTATAGVSGPITSSSVSITGGSITGITDLAVADGGTGASTANNALNNLLPSQTGNANKYLQTDGTNSTWDAVSLSTADITGTLGVANGGTGVTTSTGTTNVVLSNSPTLVTPALGTPSALVGTNITGTASGLTAGNVTTNANLTGGVTSVGNAATVVTNANLTGAVTSTGNATSLGSFTSAQLAGALTDETGSGANVFATSPTLVTPTLGVATATSLQGIIGNVTPAAGSFTTLGASSTATLNTLSSSGATLTGGTINGMTVGATTASTGAFTTVTASTAIGTASGGTGLGGATPFTSGGVVYASSASALATGSALTFNGSKLTVTSSGEQIKLTSSGDFSSTGTGYLRFYDSVGAKGFVGYGGTASIFDINTGPSMNLNMNAVGGTMTFQISNSEQMRLTSTGLKSSIAGTNADPVFSYTADTNTGIFFPAADKLGFTAGGGTDQMVLTTTGLGIGTSSPSSRLTTSGATGASNGLTIIDIDYSNDTHQIFGANSLHISAGTGGVGAILFKTAGTERIRIDSSAGNLLVGTNSTFSGTSFFQAGSGIYASYFRQAHASNPLGLLVNYSGASPNGTGNPFFEGNDTTSARVVLRSNGGIANFSANDVNLSDRREKTNFAPAKSYLDTICAIPVQTFNYIDQNMEEDGGLTLGVVAQDVQAVAPELVMESNWGTAEEPKQRLSIYQTDLQYALMKCIQEQQALITALTARISALESN